MIIKISYPYKKEIDKIETQNIYIKTNDNNLIKELLKTNNPIEIGIILSENENKFKTTHPQQADKEIIIKEPLIDPKLRFS